MISEKAMQRMKSKVQQRVGATPPATWAKVGVGVLVGGVAIGWIAFPYVLDKVVASQINLAQGRDSRRLWVQLPTLGCNMYVFNVTNPSEVMRGAKMVVEEIGPYCYKEVKDKTDFVEDPTSDTISYSARTTWYENQRSPSCPAPHLTGDELIVVPNVPILSILLIAEKDFPAPFLTLVSQALPAIFGRVNDLFMRVTARTLLFDGLLINCTATALYPRAVCIALKQNSRALKKISENVYSFSFFGAKNHTPEEFRYTVKRGTVDGQDIGRLVALDGKPELPFWRGDCNKIQGTDASVFPPFRKMENGSLVAYSSEACRIIFGIFEGEDNYKGVTGYVYSAYPFGDADTNPGDRCYCPSDDRCRKRGALDSLKCQGAPLVASHPHFYQASPQYIDGVEGLNPDKEKHGIKIMLEPISGTPLIVRKRIQFNIDLRPIRFVPLTQGLRRTLVPLFWAEELLDLEGDLMGMLEASLFRPIRAVDVIKWMCVVGGVGLGVLGVVLKIRKHRRDKVHAINGEVGQEFDYESDPKSVIKPSVINGGNEVFDPFYINPVKNEEKSGKIMNGQQLVISKKSASTMTTPNVSRPASFVKLDVKQLSLSKGIQNGNTFLRNHPHVNDSASFFVAKERNEIPEIHTNVGKHTKEDEKLQIQTNVSSSPTEFQNTSSVNLHSPKIFSSLEHQISFKSPSRSINNLNLAQSETEKLPMSNQKKLRTSHSLENVRNNGDVEPDQAVESVLASNKNPTILDNVFGDSIEENQPEYVIPHQNIGESDSLPNKDNNETSDRDSDPDSSKGETEPSAEVIKAVEEDMNKLIAEMAKLMPKNKTVEINDD